MASVVAGDMKGFYREKKNAKSSESSTKPASGAATFVSDITQAPALISQDDYNEYEEILREFDMNMAYGPCLGMSRLARWERARNLDLNPPEEIKRLLKSGKGQTVCLWDGCI